MEEKEVIYTGDVPQCPYCNKPTTRIEGMTTTTCLYSPPAYDELGNNINPDRNTNIQYYRCVECDGSYAIKGNGYDGYKYI